jgi:uncharacterized protein YjbK
VGIIALYFRALHVRAHPDKNIEKGLEVVANVMVKFLAIAQHDFERHEWRSALEIRKVEVRNPLTSKRGQKSLQSETHVRLSAQMMA